MTKFFTLIAAVLIGSTPAAAQVTRIETNNPAPKLGNPDRIVCEVDQTTGTRLGATKVCKTVLEWQQMRTEHRETVEQFQRMNTSVGCPDGQATCQH
jgi:hypothetical protein